MRASSSVAQGLGAYRGSSRDERTMPHVHPRRGVSGARPQSGIVSAALRALPLHSAPQAQIDGQSTSDEHRTRSRFRAFNPKVRT